MTNPLSKRVFAVAVGRNWIELQISKSPPKPTVTATVRYVNKTDWRYNENWARDMERNPYKQIVKKVPIKMAQTVFTGGKVIHTMKASRFTRLTKIALRAGGMFELSTDLINLLNNKEHFYDKASSDIPISIEPSIDQGSAAEAPPQDPT